MKQYIYAYKCLGNELSFQALVSKIFDMMNLKRIIAFNTLDM